MNGAFKYFSLVLGPIVFAVLCFLPTPAGLTVEGQRAGALAILMGIWWMTEAIPLAATALLPIALFPLLGIMPGTTVTACYGDPSIYLFAGGFFIAMAMQKWKLHERVALNIILRTGVSHARLLLGFMLATGFISMWISNSATAMMMYPIGIAVVGQMESSIGKEKAVPFAIALLLTIAYASNIGGLGTLIGTPTNLVLVTQMRSLFPDAPPVSFVQWMVLCVPMVLIYLLFTWWLLAYVLYPAPGVQAPKEIRHALADQLKNLGHMSRGERGVAIIGCTTALAWIFRADADVGAFTIHGWSDLFPMGKYIDDTTVAIFFAALLFIIPVDLEKREFLLDWQTAVKIPWGVLILFGGGLAVAKAFSETKLIHWLGSRLGVLGDVSPIVMIALIVLFAIVISEFASNTATATIIVPVMAATAVGVLHIHPLFLMVPATIGASCAFMLPVGTPPNAIVFGSGHLSIRDMLKAGLILDLAGVVLVTALVYGLLGKAFGISIADVPSWAASFTQ
jgi:sodium-dependent dicarboxylate transporter 2/3/5